MVFSSSIFLFLFLPLVILCYHILKENYRIYFLLIVSLLFYAWSEPKHIFIILLSIAINYIFGLFINKCILKKRKSFAKLLLVISIIGNLGVLFYFKYLNFTLNSINYLCKTDIIYHNVVLPIGISFFTFQGMSYVIDLYWQKVSVQKNPAKLAFFISFFPQLIAGPIVRYVDIEKQISERIESPEKFVAGIQRFIVGLAKKVIIANNVGFVTDLIFTNPAVENTPASAWLGIICYTFQIYFDFSGYSDMAIGLGKLFGFEFLENFNYPYISKTVTEFWRRWHISLSSWFRDYVYIPLGGNRRGNVYVNLIFIFVLTGLWHGASFNFLVWGLWHGLALIIERLFSAREVRNKAYFPLRYLITMLIVVIGWVFFRAPDLRYAFTYLGIMFGMVKPENVGFTIWYYLSPKISFVIGLATVVSIPVLKIIHYFFDIHSTGIQNLIKYGFLFIVFFISIIFVTASSYNPFIYFRF